MIINIIDNLWMARNVMIYENKNIHVEEIVSRANQRVNNCIKANNSSKQDNNKNI